MPDQFGCTLKDLTAFNVGLMKCPVAPPAAAADRASAEVRDGTTARDTSGVARIAPEK
jgi:hypothetical protein